MNSFNAIEQFACAEVNSFCLVTLGSCLDVCEDELNSFFPSVFQMYSAKP